MKKLSVLFLIFLFSIVIHAEKHVFTRDVKGSINTKESCRPFKSFNNDFWKNLCTEKQSDGYYLCTSGGKPYYAYVFSSKKDCNTALVLLKKYVSEMN